MNNSTSLTEKITKKKLMHNTEHLLFKNKFMKIFFPKFSTLFIFVHKNNVLKKFKN